MKRSLSRDEALVAYHVARSGVPKVAELDKSRLAQVLLQFAAWGLLSAPKIQQIAEAAVHDGLKNEAVEKLARVGDYGKYSGNARRDLQRSFGAPNTLPPPLEIKLPLLIKGEVQWVDYPILLPHQLFHALWENISQLFNPL